MSSERLSRSEKVGLRVLGAAGAEQTDQADEEGAGHSRLGEGGDPDGPERGTAAAEGKEVKGWGNVKSPAKSSL